MSARALSFLLACVLAAATTASSAERYITLASTTSTQNSGLFDHLLPMFSAATGIEVRVVAVGTGQALRLAARCDADVLLVHHRPSEEKFVSEGNGVARHGVMHNDFVLVGPRGDPARVRGERDAALALGKIASKRASFASRGDDSGTHKKERSLWADAGVDLEAASGAWYRETGSGMGATLNTAAGMGAYTLSDRGTWLAFANKGDLEILSEGDPRLANPYGIILVNALRCAHVKTADGQSFIDWLLSPEGQGAIAGYERNGEPLFFPDAQAGTP